METSLQREPAKLLSVAVFNLISEDSVKPLLSSHVLVIGERSTEVAGATIQLNSFK